ncbi:MAG: CIA30 family protein [Verrucomicrobiales bacterium]|nr:CIA30 family protein [Verrucomicrobiales bacterium]
MATMLAGQAADRTLFGLDKVTNPAFWTVVNDDVMGGLSTSRFEALACGGAIFKGTVRRENNGGFASVRTTPLASDLSNHAAFVIRVRGDGKRYKFTVRTGAGFDAPLYQCAFTTTLGTWEEHRLEFKDFVPTFRGSVLRGVPPLDPGTATSVGFLISDQQYGPFRLELAWMKISAAKNEP